ncbi:MAG: hypothetical protein WB626_02350 [Bacteroidota bacterium]
MLGIRMVGGFGYLPPDTPLEVFLEIAPVLNLVPAAGPSLNGGAGLRICL